MAMKADANMRIVVETRVMEIISNQLSIDAQNKKFIILN